ncbi:hypothetical protein ACO2Q3_12150 [Caulobacter sp. KR2-114]|uniref:hypothetical protein n=1 Tax=Caulobacter sp. KR2-114 TaxID=3400912 RepID=UPI003C12156A
MSPAADAPLANARHEAFAQALARGVTPNAAYAAAGYTPGNRNGARLKTQPAIAARVAALQAEASGAGPLHPLRGSPSPRGGGEPFSSPTGGSTGEAGDGGSSGEPAPALTLARVTEALLRLAAKNEALESAAGYSAARAALMDAARLNGLLVERAEADLSLRLISDRPLTAEEWSALHAPPAVAPAGLDDDGERDP